jgi:hypothetical protein
VTDIIPSDIFERLPERYQNRARQIAARVLELNRLLARCDIGAIRDSGARLCGQLRPQPETKIEEFADEFRAACADLPEWAISEATNDYLAGRVDNHTGQFIPTCAEFAKHARGIIRPFVAEKAGLRNEAERLFIRAEDDRRRELIEIERANPTVKARVRDLVKQSRAGAPVISTDHRHFGIEPEAQAQLDALRKPPVPVQSKIAQSRIVKGR